MDDWGKLIGDVPRSTAILDRFPHRAELTQITGKDQRIPAIAEISMNASPADLDGDGEYEIIIHMTGRGRDNSQAGFTDEPILHAYKLNGTLLWVINL